MSNSDKARSDESGFVEEIQAALGNQRPLTCWYISATLVDQVPLETFENITSEPSLFAEVIRLHSGGCLVVIHAARTGQDAVEEMLGALGALYGITPAEVV